MARATRSRRQNEQRAPRGAPFERAETAAGFLAAISLTASALAIVYRPLRLAPFAILIALIASALAEERHKRLAAAAVVAATLAWLAGMAIAVLLSSPMLLMGAPGCLSVSSPPVTGPEGVRVVERSEMSVRDVDGLNAG